MPNVSLNVDASDLKFGSETVFPIHPRANCSNKKKQFFHISSLVGCPFILLRRSMNFSSNFTTNRFTLRPRKNSSLSTETFPWHTKRKDIITRVTGCSSNGYAYNEKGKDDEHFNHSFGLEICKLSASTWINWTNEKTDVWKMKRLEKKTGKIASANGVINKLGRAECASEQRGDIKSAVTNAIDMIKTTKRRMSFRILPLAVGSEMVRFSKHCR